MKLLDNIPSDSLSKGAVGVVVMGFIEPEEVCEVEFCNGGGETISQVVLHFR